MLLALDIGNSTIVAALFDREKKLAETTVSSTVQRSRDETWDIVQPLINQTEGDALDGVGISSVVPFLTHVFTTLSREKLGIEPLIISGSLDLGITIHYDDPTTLGSDRICSAIAAYAKYHGPLIVIDFGTATTYGVVSANGDFLGGLISLGVKTSLEALHRRAAQLPSVELRTPSHGFATNTLDAINAGTIMSATAAVEGIVKRIRKHLGTDANVIATGGLSAFMTSQTTIIDACEPSLVLEGVRLIWESRQTPTTTPR
jgi:type III pantothenate kinase